MDEAFEMPESGWSAWAKRHAAPIRVLSFVAGAIAVGYLWAVLFGDGVKGLQSSAQLDNSSTFPNANAAWCGSIALLGASLLAAAKDSESFGIPRAPAQSLDGRNSCGWCRTIRAQPPLYLGSARGADPIRSKRQRGDAEMHWASGWDPGSLSGGL